MFAYQRIIFLSILASKSWLPKLVIDIELNFFDFLLWTVNLWTFQTHIKQLSREIFCNIKHFGLRSYIFTVVVREIHKFGSFIIAVWARDFHFVGINYCDFRKNPQLFMLQQFSFAIASLRYLPRIKFERDLYLSYSFDLRIDDNDNGWESNGTWESNSPFENSSDEWFWASQRWEVEQK